MANIQSIPYEILRLVFQHIASTKQLGKCRLVCKSWNDPAECAMFSRQLYITDENTISIYKHLVKKPQRAHLIKEINLSCYCLTGTTAQLFKLAITPSIERILALNNQYNTFYIFYDTLISIVKDSKVKLHHLKSIPLPNSLTKAQYEAAMLLKGSLEEISIPRSKYYTSLIPLRLQEFEHLSTLHVNCVFQSLPQADLLFDGAPHLKEVNLYDCSLNEAWTNEQSLDWMSQHVEINQNVITLKAVAERSLSATLIEYFLYKYPNIRHFDFDASNYSTGSTTTGVENSESICSKICKIPSYTLSLMNTHLMMNSPWRNHYRLFAGRKNALQLYYDITTINQISSKMEQGKDRSTKLQFWVYCLSDENFITLYTNLFNDIGDFTTSITMHFDGIYCRRWPESKAFFRALQVMHYLENFKFVSLGTLESVDLDLSTLRGDRRLNTLEISGAEIQAEVFPTLSRVFDVIGDLTLSFCYIEKDPRNTTRIYLPSTSVRKIFWNMQTDKGTLQRDKQSEFGNKIKLRQDTYLMIELQQRVILFFKLTPSSSHVHQLSFAEYYNRPQSANNLLIQCKLLASIQLDLGEIVATIDVQNYCTTLDAAFKDLSV